MDIESMKYYGLLKEFDKADYFETDQYQSLLSNIHHALKTGGLMALTGIVGMGKTMTLRRLQQFIRDENKVIVSKSLATDKRHVTINTLYTALFADLATKKDGKLPTQAETRERKLQGLIKEINKPVVLFIDEAHDLHPRTLIGLKHLMETVQDAHGILSVLLVGHPKLANDLKNPALEEIGARSRLFELNSLGGYSPRFIEWLMNNCSKESVKPQEIMTKEAMTFLAETLITPLQITYYLARALEKGYQIGEKPVSLETVHSITSPNLNDLEANLARHGYTFAVLCEKLNARRQEIKAYLHGQLNPSRLEELNREIHKLGIVV
jgi:type II secretory pathway predicted ATPase ExeA